MKIPVFLAVALALACVAPASAKIKVLIVDGQNNHTVWPKATAMMKAYFESSGQFEVSVARTQYTWQGKKWLQDYPLADGKKYTELPEPKADPTFAPDFSKYDVVVSNFGWKAADWPAGTRKALEDFVSRGGGFVSVHAANNSFPGWKAYNEMIGLGGWGDRNEKSGPFVYYDKAGKLVRDTSPGNAGAHGPQHSFVVETRVSDHPITAGLPKRWLHTQDELYEKLRGPADHMTVLATAYAAPAQKGSDRNEPMLMVIDYGKGRVFHTAMGHEDYSIECVGFITTLLRGTEWAATGKVTIPVPKDFPTETETKKRPFAGK